MNAAPVRPSKSPASRGDPSSAACGHHSGGSSETPYLNVADEEVVTDDDEKDLFADAVEDEAIDQDEVIELEGDEEEEECAPRRTAPEPGDPTEEEAEAHRVDHLPFRSWCQHCVAGRGTGEQHRRGPAGSVPVVSMDYLIVTKAGVFTKEEGVERSEILMKILVLKDSQSKYVGAHVVPVKGLGEDRYAAERVRRDIMWLG